MKATTVAIHGKPVKKKKKISQGKSICMYLMGRWEGLCSLSDALKSVSSSHSRQGELLMGGLRSFC